MAFHHRVTVSKESIRAHTEAAGEVYVQLQVQVQVQEQEQEQGQGQGHRPAVAQASTPTAPALPIEPGCDRHMLCVDAAKVLTTTGEWRDVKTLTLAEVLPDGKTRQNSYFSRMSEYRLFAQQAQVEVRRRQLKSSRAVCAVNDGADWIPAVVTACRPDAVRILDFYHAAEHLAESGRAVWGSQSPEFQGWFEHYRRELKEGNPDHVLAGLADLAARYPAQAEVINATQGYLTQRRETIRYAEFKAAQWPIGNGPGEAAHKVVIQSRMKRAGMRWHPGNIDRMAAMRNLICNERWDSDWPLIVTARLANRSQLAASPPSSTSSMVAPGTSTAATVAASSSRLPSGFTLRPGVPWRHQPVGRARARPSSPVENG